MFDTMTMTKAVGAVCGSLLVFLLAGWAATSLYTVGGEEGNGEEVAQAYVIETGAEEPAAAAEEGPDFATLLASADVAAGEAVFKKCAACHNADKGGPNALGPNLYGTMGKPHGHVAGFAYSDALKSVPGTWTWDAMSAWLKSPKAYAPGTKMTFAGLSKPEDRANIMAYLKAQGGGPDFPAPKAADAAAPAEGEAPAASTEGETPANAAAAGATAAETPAATTQGATKNPVPTS